MKMSVIYYSATGNTGRMAEVIADGMNLVSGAEARAFSIDAVDEDFVRESKCIVMGCPTYAADTPAAFHTWLEQRAGKLALPGKLGGAFSTAQYIHGGDEFVIRAILDHMMVMGMLTYSGGGSKGKPVIHLGPVAIATAGNTEALKPFEETFQLYGQRMADKAVELFG
ncbi:MAG: flavodoxin domain-containing protein [Clostridiales bacterium]|nr:flavodoxin domain-containing protein [Clostridiales bacterium]